MSMKSWKRIPALPLALAALLALAAASLAQDQEGPAKDVDQTVAKPRKFALDELVALAPMEERIYRHRCVEAWSIVVPWVGYSLSVLLKQAQPTAKAQYVAFESYYSSSMMLSSEQAGIEFPYVEGLRLDEAMHPLAMLTFGMYGDSLPPQDGAPVRLTVPWKHRLTISSCRPTISNSWAPR